AELLPFLRLEGRGYRLVHELEEILVARGEIRLDVHLDEDAALAVRRNARRDHALARDRSSALRALGEPLLEDHLDRGFHVAVGLRQRVLAIVEASLSAIPQLLDLTHTHLTHNLLPSVIGCGPVAS